MRVICIDGAIHGDELVIWGQSPMPKEGVVYQVSQHSGYDDCYLIIELDPFAGYRKFRFAPLSTICETEMERNYNTQPV